MNYIDYQFNFTSNVNGQGMKIFTKLAKAFSHLRNLGYSSVDNEDDSYLQGEATSHALTMTWLPFKHPEP